MKRAHDATECGWQTSDELIRALGEKYTPAILRATQEPRSASELSDELDIPAATCYRRLDKLSELGILEENQRIKANPRGSTTVYSRRIDDIRIEFSDGRLDVTTEQASETTTKMNDLWRELNTG
ncbi:MAG: winged helix-turn-helix domain-containing protein [Halorientalis sp.]